MSASEQQTAPHHASFELHAWPRRIVVRRHQPIKLNLALKNVTRQDDYVRIWFSPVPFGPHTDLHALMLSCRDRATGREVRYTWPPAGRTVADAQGKEFPQWVPAGKAWFFVPDLRDYCVLPPGRYELEAQYDTRFTPS